MASQGSSQGYKGSSQGYKGSSQGYKGSSQGYKGSSQGYKGSSQGYKGSSQGSSQGTCGSQNDRYKELLHPVRDPSKNFEIELCELLKIYMETVDSNYEEDIISGSQQSTVNFSEAALMIQASSSIYGKKVDYLLSLAYQLMQSVNNEKKAASGKTKDKDLLLAGRNNDGDFTLADDVKYVKPDAVAHNLESLEAKYLSLITRLVPLPLMPLDDTEKGDINVKTMSGDIMGKTKDLQIEVCNILHYGCTFLPTLTFKHQFDDDPGFSNSTFFTTRIRDNEPNNVSCINENSHIGTPNELPVNGTMDMDNDNYSVHDDPIFDSPAICDTPSPAVKEAPEVEIMRSAALPPRRRSERQAAKAAEQKMKPEKQKKKETWSVSTDDVKDKQVPLVDEPSKSVKKSPKSEQSPKSRAQNLKNSVEYVNQMRRKRRKHNAMYLKVCPLDSKSLKKLPVEANVGINAALHIIVTVSCKLEMAKKKKVGQKLEINEETSSEAESRGSQESNENQEPVDSQPDSSGEAPNQNGSSIDMDGGGVDDFDGAPCPSPGLHSDHEEENEPPRTFEGILRTHIDNYLKGSQKFTASTDLTQRVKAWEDKIKPIIEAENEREVFNIHQYGTRIIDNFGDNNRKQSLPFADICKGKKKWEVCRYFLASLILANNNNVEISSSAATDGIDDVSLTLLSRKRHQEQLDAFGHNSGEHE